MRRAVLAAVALLAMAASAWPQASTATAGGTVRDQSGAVVANMQVGLTDTATNVNSTVRTNEAGVNIFPGVNPGPYRLVVEAAGMQRYESAFTVTVAQRFNHPDNTNTIGGDGFLNTQASGAAPRTLN
jgi:hypothetical protein